LNILFFNKKIKFAKSNFKSTVVKTFAEEIEDELWEDEIFLNKLDRRTAEYESGKIKPLTLDEIEDKARKSYKSKLAKRK